LERQQDCLWFRLFPHLHADHPGCPSVIRSLFHLSI
jgi:hypothetical protein